MLSVALFTLLIRGITETNVNRTLPCLGQVYCESAKGEECCPLEYGCDVQKGCLRSDNEIKYPKELLRKCPYDATLCYILYDVEYCCNYRNAECCADKKHCCPHDYVCDIPHFKCYKKKSLMLSKSDVVYGKLNHHLCGGDLWCTEEDECCKDGKGEWRCCRELAEPFAIKK